MKKIFIIILKLWKRRRSFILYKKAVYIISQGTSYFEKKEYVNESYRRSLDYFEKGVFENGGYMRWRWDDLKWSFECWLLTLLGAFCLWCLFMVLGLIFSLVVPEWLLEFIMRCIFRN